MQCNTKMQLDTKLCDWCNILLKKNLQHRHQVIYDNLFTIINFPSFMSKIN